MQPLGERNGVPTSTWLDAPTFQTCDQGWGDMNAVGQGSVQSKSALMQLLLDPPPSQDPVHQVQQAQGSKFAVPSPVQGPSFQVPRSTPSSLVSHQQAPPSRGSRCLVSPVQGPSFQWPRASPAPGSHSQGTASVCSETLLSPTGSVHGPSFLGPQAASSLPQGALLLGQMDVSPAGSLHHPGGNCSHSSMSSNNSSISGNNQQNASMYQVSSGRTPSRERRKVRRCVH